MAFQFTIELSNRLYDLTHSRRVWNTIQKEALREELVKHHEDRIPKHFKREARAKYQYEERKPGYKEKKLYIYHSQRDLVKRGTTEAKVTRQRKITMRGSIQSGLIVGNLIMELPFPVTRDPDKVNVTVEDMKREIAAITPDEEEAMALGFLLRTRDKMDARYSGPSKQVYRSK